MGAVMGAGWSLGRPMSLVRLALILPLANSDVE